MRTRTLLIIGIAVLILLAGGLGVFILLNKKDATSSQTPQANPFVFTPTDTSTGTTPQRTLYTTNGTKVTVPDFAKDSPSTVIGQTADDVQLDLTPYPEYQPGTPFPTHEFDVVFNQKNSEFVVTLNQEPLGHARTAAEAFIALKLGISPKDLCAFNVTITVPYSVNERFGSYGNLGASACTGAVSLPK